MEKTGTSTASNGIARFLGVTVKRLENEIKSFFPYLKWLAGTEEVKKQPRQETAAPLVSPVIPPPASGQSLSTAPVAPPVPVTPVPEPIIEETPAESLNGVEVDNKAEQLRQEVIFADLQSPDRHVREQAEGELKNFSRPAALKLLEKLLSTERDPLRILEALNVLSGIGNGAPVTRQIFKRFSAHEDSAVRLSALRLISKYRDPEAFNMLSAHVKDRDVEVRRRILNYLCWDFEDQALPFAMNALHDANPQIRKTAAQIMGALKSYESVTALITLLNDSDKEAQEAANQALKKITGKDFGFDPCASHKHKEGAIEHWQKWWLDNQIKYGRSRHSAALK